MNPEPFAYGIQAPIGSVTPLFHKRKDAEDYIAKLTDSRDEAKIIPLYRSAPTLADFERETTHWRLEAEVHRKRANAAVSEIARLSRERDESAVAKELIAAGAEIARLRLTDAEREFLQNLRGAYEELVNQTGYVNAASQKEARTFADLIGGLLERTK